MNSANLTGTSTRLSIQHPLPGVCCLGRLFNKCGRHDHWLQLAKTFSIFFCWLEFDKTWQKASPPCQQRWLMVLRCTMLGPFGLLLVYSIDVLTSRRFAIISFLSRRSEDVVTKLVISRICHSPLHYFCSVNVQQKVNETPAMITCSLADGHLSHNAESIHIVFILFPWATVNYRRFKELKASFYQNDEKLVHSTVFMIRDKWSWNVLYTFTTVLDFSSYEWWLHFPSPVRCPIFRFRTVWLAMTKLATKMK